MKSDYIIRIADTAGTLCAGCGKQSTGSGPVGYLNDHPICDLCLLEGDSELGLVLAAICVTRAYASASGTPEERQDALEELGAFARVYHRIASKTWPARILRVPGFNAKDDTTH